ncbi:MAG: hypothetical protein RL634_1513 [Bacteroidota bacterium]
MKWTASKRILLLLLTFIIFKQDFAQVKILRAKIFDMHSEEPVPFASVQFYRTNFAKLSDSAGNFRFILEKWPSDTLLISYAGFEDNYLHLDTSLSEIDLVIKMERKKIVKEVVVKSKIGRGLILWRKIVKNKPINDRSRFTSFSYELYNKLEIDLNNVNVEKMQKGILPPKPFKFILNSVDSTSEENPILPIYLIETISDYYKQTNPYKSREIIKASKTIGFNNESFSRFTGGMYQNINVYKNFIPVFEKQYVSPISDDGDTYYHYKVPDTQFIAGKRYFHLVFSPKRGGENTFQGDAWIADSSFAVQKMNLLVSPGSNINFVDKLSLVQEYQLINDSIWFLSKDKFVANINLTSKKNLSLIGKKTTYYKNVVLNSDTIPSAFNDDILEDNRREIIDIKEGAGLKSDSFWLANRHQELNKNESNFYKMADSILKMPEYVNYREWMYFIGTGYRYLGNYEIGPWMNWISSNQYEGFRMRFDLGTNYHFNKKIYLGSYLAYGTKDQKIKGKAEVLYMIGKNPRSSIRFIFKNDMDYGQTYYDEIGYDNLFAMIFRKSQVPLKLIKIKQTKLEYFKEWKSGLSFTANVWNKKYTPIQNLPTAKDMVGNLQAGNFNDFQINLKLRFAYLEKFLQDDFFRRSLGSDYPVTELQYTKGLKGVLNSNYSYSKISFSISDYLKIPPAGNFYYNAYAGKIFGTLPYMLLSMAPGNEIYYYNKYAFNTMNRFEYLFDKYAGLNVEHVIGSGLFRFFPHNKKLKLRQFWNAKMLWGGLSQENKELNLKNFSNFTTLDNKTFMEVGTGVDNIFRFFRIDCTWRVLPRPLPTELYKRFGIFGSFRFTF